MSVTLIVRDGHFFFFIFMNKSRRDDVQKWILLVESVERMANPTKGRGKRNLSVSSYSWKRIKWQQQNRNKKENKSLWNVFKARGFERGESRSESHVDQPNWHSSCGYSDESHRFLLLLLFYFLFLLFLSVRLYYTSSPPRVQGWCSRGKE